MEKEQKDILKLYEKDIKNLSTFFIEKNLFIKIHMVYKKVIPNFSGFIFIVSSFLINNILTIE